MHVVKQLDLSYARVSEHTVRWLSEQLSEHVALGQVLILEKVVTQRISDAFARLFAIVGILETVNVRDCCASLSLRRAIRRTSRLTLGVDDTLG